MIQQMTLREMIDRLKRFPDNATVSFDFGYMTPTKVRSYRGYYEQLAIGYKADGGSMTVKQLTEMLEGAVGSDFQGYKGGTYTMHGRTLMWAANYGRADNTAIIGIVGSDYGAVILTAHEDYFDDYR